MRYHSGLNRDWQALNVPSLGGQTRRSIRVLLCPSNFYLLVVNIGQFQYLSAYSQSVFNFNPHSQPVFNSNPQSQSVFSSLCSNIDRFSILLLNLGWFSVPLCLIDLSVFNISMLNQSVGFQYINAQSIGFHYITAQSRSLFNISGSNSMFYLTAQFFSVITVSQCPASVFHLSRPLPDPQLHVCPQGPGRHRSLPPPGHAYLHQQE